MKPLTLAGERKVERKTHSIAEIQSHPVGRRQTERNDGNVMETLVSESLVVVSPLQSALCNSSVSSRIDYDCRRGSRNGTDCTAGALS
ncbi:hypothetical protein CY34DRAFT_469473 [Suillus luteus UH-Slu-Lm8-n1]|uniref:Uncharacterized protein n=1 Tax=Suillus luteus UH-Slu-Lm8-n1 TaxID=930992 RepID=A0A0D0AGF5_9AGAM|nr:hypothetical protein CY34DRAFT_469473 [Suillus luteus UH-Slu-Lm8-n1]